MAATAAAAAMVSCNARMALSNGMLIVPARSSVEVEASSVCGGSSRASLGCALQSKKKKKMTSSMGYSRIPSRKNSRAFTVVRASLQGEGERVREWASETAVEAGFVNTSDTGFDAKVEELSDATSYDTSVRDSVLDVASDSAIDTQAGIDEVAREDAEGIAQDLGRSVEDTVVGLEDKASEVADRESRKESSGNPPVVASGGPNFKDQELKGSILDVASDAAVDNQPEVDAEAEKDAQGMVDKFGGSLKLTQINIQELAEVAAKLDSQRASAAGTNAGSGQGENVGAKQSPTIEQLTESGVKIVKEGIDSERPSIEETSKQIASGLRQGVDKLQLGVDSFVEIKTKLKQKAGEVQATFSKLVGYAQKELQELQSAEEEDNMKLGTIPKTATDQLNEEAISSKQSVSDPISMMSQNYEDEVGNDQLAAAGKGIDNNQESARASLTDTDPVAIERDDEWKGKSSN